MSYRGQATVIELKPDRWRAVHVRGEGHSVDVVAVEESVATGDEALASWIKELAAAGFPVTNTVLILDAENSSLRYHSVPPVPSWRLDLILHYEIEEIAEKSGEALSGGHMELQVPESLSEDTLLLLGVGKDAEIQPIIDGVRDGKGQVRLAIPSAIGTFQAHLTTGKFAEDETVLLCDVQETETQVLVVRDDRLLFARTVRIGLQDMINLVAERCSLSPSQARRMIDTFAAGDLVSGEDALIGCHRGWISQLTQMLQSSLTFCQAQLKMEELTADIVRLSGVATDLLLHGGELQRSLDCDIDVISFPDSPGPAWTLAVGAGAAALDGEERVVDLLPDAERKRRTFRDHTRYLWAGAAALVLALGVQFLDVSLASGRASVASETIRSWRSDISTWKAAEDQAREQNDVFRKRESRIVQEMETGRFYARILDRLREDLPGEISLEQISLRRVAGDSGIGIEIELSGLADDSRRKGLEAIQKFQRMLEAIPGVERVRVTPDDPKSGAYPFNILVSPVDSMPESSGRSGPRRRIKSPFGGRG